MLVLLLCKGYRPLARGYVIYSPRALPEGATAYFYVGEDSSSDAKI